LSVLGAALSLWALLGSPPTDLLRELGAHPDDGLLFPCREFFGTLAIILQSLAFSIGSSIPSLVHDFLIVLNTKTPPPTFPSIFRFCSPDKVPTCLGAQSRRFAFGSYFDHRLPVMWRGPDRFLPWTALKNLRVLDFRTSPWLLQFSIHCDSSSGSFRFLQPEPSVRAKTQSFTTTPYSQTTHPDETRN